MFIPEQLTRKQMTHYVAETEYFRAISKILDEEVENNVQSIDSFMDARGALAGGALLGPVNGMMRFEARAAEAGPVTETALANDYQKLIDSLEKIISSWKKFDQAFYELSCPPSLRKVRKKSLKLLDRTIRKYERYLAFCLEKQDRPEDMVFAELAPFPRKISIRFRRIRENLLLGSASDAGDKVSYYLQHGDKQQSTVKKWVIKPLGFIIFWYIVVTLLLAWREIHS